MPRTSRKSLGSNFFHVIVQGIKKEYIFNKNIYIEKYLHLLKEKTSSYSTKIISYCIMNNHAHILFYSENIQELSSIMKAINTSYALFYNKCENRVGYVFRDRFVSEPILNEKYLQNCIAYIHNNPVKAKMVKSSSQYKSSSYNDYIYKTGFINDTVLQLVFGSTKDYLSQFLIIHDYDEIHFKEYIEDFIDYKLVIQDYSNNPNYSLHEIIQNKDWKSKENQEFLINLIIDLKEKSGLSLRSISQILKINRQTLSKMLHQHF